MANGLRTLCASRLLRGGLLACTLALSTVGCYTKQAPMTQAIPGENVPEDALLISANTPWTDTGVEVVAGEPLTISSGGKIKIARLKQIKDDTEKVVGPQGTFLYPDTEIGHPFPLPAAGAGPAPCYCLIGRIGNGEPFYVGPACSIVAKETGHLWLGVNDYDISCNEGEFFAQVTKPSAVQPTGYREEVPLEIRDGAPELNAPVVVIYVDGLRPDVVEELAAIGHIPNIKKIFVNGGSHLCNAFTAFPSDTITSNGTMWTGVFSDRHGLKGQVRFSRRQLTSFSFLETMGPAHSSQHLRPHGVEKVIHNTQYTAINMYDSDAGAHKWRASQTSDVPALYEHLRAQGRDWGTGILPVMTDMPPLGWTKSMTRFLPYFQAHKAWQYVDDANAHYAINTLLAEKRPVTVIWMPETDSVSHKMCRGQFGITRKTIQRADKLIGDIVNELKGMNRLDETYLVLVSDHGHHGGRDSHLSRFDLSNEFFYASRKMSKEGDWVGGGMGMSVRQHRSNNWHNEDGDKQFVFIDGDSDGTARIFLPKGDYHSNDWSGPNSAAALLQYRIADHLRPVNLIDTLAATKAVNDQGQVCHPLDLILMRLSDNSILVTTQDRGQAVIERVRDPMRRWQYRYTVVSNVHVDAKGEVAYDPVLAPRTDPLGVVERVHKTFLQAYHDEETWLWVTTNSQYPDAVVTLTRHMLWQENLREQEPDYAPDIVVTARPGWFIGIQNTPGTTHGYPLADAMRATFYVSGPNIRRGARIKAPCRLVDLTPTLLMLTGTPFDPCKLDGKPILSIFQPQGEQKVLSREEPRYWNDVDLAAWHPLQYTPANQYDHQPWTMSDSNNGWDVNNIAFNAISIGDWSVFRLVDDVLSPLIPGKTKVAVTADKIDHKVEHIRAPWIAEGTHALNVTGVVLGDYSPTSLGNMRRIDGTIDWVQDRGTHLDQRLAAPLGKKSVLGSRQSNAVIDGLQYGIWETYRFGQRLFAEILDDTVLSGLENTVDAGVNSFRKTPAEVLADPAPAKPQLP